MVEESLTELGSDTNGRVPIIGGTGLDAVQGPPLSYAEGSRQRRGSPLRYLACPICVTEHGCEL